MLSLDPGGRTGRGERQEIGHQSPACLRTSGTCPCAAKAHTHVPAPSLRTSPDGRVLGGPAKPPLPAGLRLPGQAPRLPRARSPQALDPRTQGLRFSVPEPRHPRVPGALVAVPSSDELPASRALTTVWSDLWPPSWEDAHAGGCWAAAPVPAAAADQGPRHGRSGPAGLTHRVGAGSPPARCCETRVSGEGVAGSSGSALGRSLGRGWDSPGICFRCVQGGAEAVQLTAPAPGAPGPRR